MSRTTVLLFPSQGVHGSRYATTLEYPGAVSTEDVELEADLGVDSVKQTELLSRGADRYQLLARPRDFRLSDYSTMGRVAAFVFGALTAPAHSSAPFPYPLLVRPGRASTGDIRK